MVWSDALSLITGMNDFNRKYSHQTTWILKVDVDEFIFPTNTDYFISGILKSTKQHYFVAPRRDFGNNHHITKQCGLILENYTACELENSSRKSMALTKYISEGDLGYAHTFKIIQ